MEMFLVCVESNVVHKILLIFLFPGENLNTFLLKFLAIIMYILLVKNLKWCWKDDIEILWIAILNIYIL